MIVFIWSGAIQLLVGPASFSSTEQMKVRSSTLATSLNQAASRLWLVEPSLWICGCAVVVIGSAVPYAWRPSGCLLFVSRLSRSHARMVNVLLWVTLTRAAGGGNGRITESRNTGPAKTVVIICNAVML